MQKFFTATIFLFAILFFSSAAFAQTGLCGSETVSSGIKGEVRLRTQSSGTDVNYDVCWPKACSSHFSSAQTTVVSDKYSLGGVDTFSYQKICMADVDSLSLSECSSVISSESGKCAPPVCDVGYLDVGLFSEKREKSGFFWTENVHRLCARGSKIQNATFVYKENFGNFSAPEQCPAGFDDSGIFREIHFNTSETYRAWRICMQFKAQNITTTTAPSNITTTTALSNLETAKTTALQNLSAMLNISSNNITVDLAEAVTWRDDSLGCPKPGYSYKITPAWKDEVRGYRVILSHEGKKYFYHSGSDGKSFYCENPEEPAPTTTSATSTTATTLKPTTTTVKPATTTYPTTTQYFPATTFPTPTVGMAACSDSDAGIAIHSAGSVRVENGTLFLDTCIANNTLINEYYCTNGNVSVYEANCTAGCLNSACRGAGEALAEKGALFVGRLIDTANYIIDLIAKGKILERGVDLLGKAIDIASSSLDLFGKLLGKGSEYVDTIEIPNKTANATNMTNITVG